MIKKTILQALACCLLSAFAARAEPIAELVTVRDGRLYPSTPGAHISALADTAAQVQASLATAQATQAAALILSNELATLRQLETERNAIGYISGYVESFSAGIEADTNMVASIVLLQPAGVVPGVGAYWDLYTYFTSDPGNWPTVTTSDSPGRTNAWDIAQSDSVILTNVIVGTTNYECYRNRVIMPEDTASAFFRVRAEVTGIGGEATQLPVNEGISVNGHAGITITIIEGASTNTWRGGVRTQ